MADRRLSAGAGLEVEPFVCEHRCCAIPNDPNHQHLFAAAQCPVCRAVEAVDKETSTWKP